MATIPGSTGAWILPITAISQPPVPSRGPLSRASEPGKSQIMPCQINSLTDLIACLETNSHDGEYIVFDAGLFAQAAQLAGYIDPDTNSFRVDKSGTQQLIVPGSVEVHVIGVANLFNGVSYHVDITGTFATTV